MQQYYQARRNKYYRKGRALRESGVYLMYGAPVECKKKITSLGSYILEIWCKNLDNSGEFGAQSDGANPRTTMVERGATLC